MYAFSRSLLAPAPAAFWAASIPVFNSFGDGGAQRGWRFAIATPHHAIPQSASNDAAMRKAFSASGYQNECISATPRSTSACAGSLHVVAKWTVPMLPRLCWWSEWSCWAKSGQARKNNARTWRMSEPPDQCRMQNAECRTSQFCILPSLESRRMQITPQVIASHGLTPDEYTRILQILGRAPNYTELGIFSV